MDKETTDKKGQSEDTVKVRTHGATFRAACIVATCIVAACVNLCNMLRAMLQK